MSSLVEVTVGFLFFDTRHSLKVVYAFLLRFDPRGSAFARSSIAGLLTTIFPLTLKLEVVNLAWETFLFRN